LPRSVEVSLIDVDDPSVVHGALIDERFRLLPRCRDHLLGQRPELAEAVGINVQRD
jgi:hypothetical protein